MSSPTTRAPGTPVTTSSFLLAHPRTATHRPCFKTTTATRGRVPRPCLTSPWSARASAAPTSSTRCGLFIPDSHHTADTLLCTHPQVRFKQEQSRTIALFEADEIVGGRLVSAFQTGAYGPVTRPNNKDTDIAPMEYGGMRIEPKYSLVFHKIIQVCRNTPPLPPYHSGTRLPPPPRPPRRCRPPPPPHPLLRGPPLLPPSLSPQAPPAPPRSGTSTSRTTQNTGNRQGTFAASRSADIPRPLSCAALACSRL